MEIFTKDTGERVLKIVVSNSLGLHLRPASMFVETTSKYKNCELKVIKDDLEINGKSIMGVMMLAAPFGCDLTFIADGDDADTLLSEIEALINSKFDED